MDALATLPLEATPPDTWVRWFAPYGCVVERGAMCEVRVGGLLIGQFERDGRDRSVRNVLLVTLAQEPKMHLGHLAKAFGVSEEYLRLLRRKAESCGLGAVLLRRTGGKERVTTRQRARLRRWFAEGAWPAEAWRRQPKRNRLSVATVQREHVRWRAETRSPAAPTTATAPPEPQLTLLAAGSSDDTAADDEAFAPPTDSTATDNETVASPGASSSDDTAAEDEDVGAVRPISAAPVQDGRMVQHLGSWIMLALAHGQGLHAEAEKHDRGSRTSLRIALDAVVTALAIGERCVEGVRRLATPTAPLLLRAGHTPTASFVRRRLWRLGEAGGAALAAGMATRYLAAARDDDSAAVFFVDNHLRPYTGQEVLRKGWRMQDRRVLPGATDYYVHDEDGRPILRHAVPSHDSLTQHLEPIAERLRDALGDEQRILLAFDRAGAYPEELAALRDARFEFVTYERKPYPELLPSAFSEVEILGDRVGLYENRLRNLGRGRGRVRRIAIRTEDHRQVNYLAVSREPAERLVEILWKRWNQENAFKHGVERWGLNQLDGRRITSYPPGTIVPNPLRRRIDHALRIARVEEGMARRILARVADGPLRHRAERDLAEALARQEYLEWLRPHAPKHAPVEETELRDTLVHHTGELKEVVDAVRIICANIEADLAVHVAPLLHRPREAKKVVRNLLAAPGNVRVARGAIHIQLAPAANRNERIALASLLQTVTGWDLTLPGDPAARPLRPQLS
jgi:hypothetical protein